MRTGDDADRTSGSAWSRPRRWLAGVSLLIAVSILCTVGGAAAVDSDETVVTAEVIGMVRLTSDCDHPDARSLDPTYVGSTAAAVTATGATACRFSFEGTSPSTLSLRQRDGFGTTMVAETGGAANTLSGGDNPMTGVSLVDANNGVTVGYAGRIRRMVAGVWAAESLPGAHIGRNMTSVDMVDATVGWAVAQGGYIFKRTAGGWINQASPVNTDLIDVSAVDANVAYAVGDGGVVLRTLNGGTNWVQLPDPEGGAGRDYKTVQALSATHVIFAGSSATVRRSSNANAVPATNVTWQAPANAPAGNVQVRSVHALSFNEIWLATTSHVYYSANFGGAGGWHQRGLLISGNAIHAVDANEAIVAGEASQFRKTTDGGSTWTNLTSPTVGRITVFDRSGDTIVVGGDVRGAWHSTDGGHSWTEVTSVKPSISGAAAAGRNLAWFVGNSGAVLRTTDGTTTSAQASGTTANLRGAKWLGTTTDGEAVVAVGDGGTIISTTDSGAQWDTVASGTSHDLYAVDSRDGQRLYAVGERGAIVTSGNGGRSWNLRDSGTTTNLWRVTVGSSPDHAWASGEEGIVLRTVDGGATWVQVGVPSAGEYVLGLHALDDSTVIAGVGSGKYYRSVNAGASFPLSIDISNQHVMDIDGLGAGMVLGVTAFSGSARLSWDGFVTNAPYGQAESYPLDVEPFDAVGAFEVNQRGGIVRQLFATPIADYAAGAWGSDSELFGVCLQDVGPDTTATWTPQSGGDPAVCEPIDADGWHPIPTAWDEIASAAAGDVGDVTLAWGMQATPATMAGAYRAAVIVEALAPDV